MTYTEYMHTIEQLANYAFGVAESKRPAYTNHDGDVLANFKRAAETVGVDPLTVWAVHAHKQLSAIATFARTGHISESIESRFADLLNYTFLGYALYKDTIQEDS